MTSDTLPKRCNASPQGLWLTRLLGGQSGGYKHWLFNGGSPAQVQENMLWVWGEAGAEAFIHSAASTPAVTAELEALPADTRVFRIGKPYSRDLYYDFETLVENFLVTHLSFAGLRSWDS